MIKLSVQTRANMRITPLTFPIFLHNWRYEIKLCETVIASETFLPRWQDHQLRINFVYRAVTLVGSRNFSVNAALICSNSMRWRCTSARSIWATSSAERRASAIRLAINFRRNETRQMIYELLAVSGKCVKKGKRAVLRLTLSRRWVLAKTNQSPRCEGWARYGRMQVINQSVTLMMVKN